MLRHTGRKRNFKHDMRLAVLLCLNAGFINAAGFLAFGVLTTNVTGHAALLAVNIATDDFRATRMVTLWLLLFFAGAFLSSWYIARIGRRRPFAYTAPIVLIIAVSIFISIAGQYYRHTLAQTEAFAGSLLFAMGVQNAMVSVISGSVVRTTHLTGMLTDLGIDAAEMMRSGTTANASLNSKIILKLTIIISFLAGGVIGGFLFLHIHFFAFYIPVGILLIALMYDHFRVTIARAISRKKTAD